VETAGLDADGMNFPPAKELHDFVARLLDREAVLDHRAMVARHAYPIGEAEEVGRMKHHHVKAVAFDPFPAINEPAERPKLPFDLGAESVLDRMDGAHLIGDRADAANARDDIGHFVVAAAAQECFEETRRLEDLELRRGHTPVADLQVECSLAFDAGEIIDQNRLSRHELRSLFGTVRRQR
jgi:hypothetical protein